MSDGEHAPWPKTVDEAVERLLAEMAAADIATLRAMPEGDLIALHLSLAVHIRNRFGLWQGNTRLLASCGQAGGARGYHPDGANGVILDALWRRARPGH